MDIYEQMEQGRQAEEFLKYVQEHPYFEEMLDRMRLGIMAEMCALRPGQTEEFKTLSERFHFLPEIVNMARSEVLIGREAYESVNGIKHAEGIL